jgi:Flp pilus assembly protein TadD
VECPTKNGGIALTDGHIQDPDSEPSIAELLTLAERLFRRLREARDRLEAKENLSLVEANWLKAMKKYLGRNK